MLSDGTLLGIVASAAAEDSVGAGKVITTSQSAKLVERNNVRFAKQKEDADYVRRPPMVLQIISDK